MTMIPVCVFWVVESDAKVGSVEEAARCNDFKGKIVAK
jgi:hypothetical protein